MQKRIKDESGMLIIEATFVYPIMLFVIFFLIYMGNMFYQKAKIESYVAREAIKGAAFYADPLLKGIYATGAIPASSNLSIEPYHYLNLHPEASTETDKLAKSLSDTGFFSGMEPSIKPIGARVNNYILYATYELEIDYVISFPIRFIFQDDYYKLHFTSRSDLPVVDSAEFIRNTDMVIDYAQHTEMGVEVSQTLNEGINKLKDLLDNAGK